MPRRPSPSAAPGAASRRVRLAPDARRQQLVDIATRLLDEHGPAGVEMTAVAEAAGITRPVIYKFFATRDALLAGVLDDFVADLGGRYHAALAGSLGAPMDRIAQAFIEASCDAIAARGAGPWRLLYARGADVAAAALGRAALHRLLAPWLPRIGELTGLPPARVELLVAIVVASGGAALDGWIEGRMRRRDAVQVATRVVTALLRELSRR
ncbi:MAG TPA: TetR/AcrR family transcriptional regulator [Kofleriaceae bacterium]|nr:TetR/AcrR family transcriptional regulator [Kofleriaceae bacterium]